LTAGDCFLGGECAYIASSGASLFRCGAFGGREGTLTGRVELRINGGAGVRCEELAGA
jgi:hypothetical protein